MCIRDRKRDIETINLELILSDLEILDRRIDRTAKAAKGDKSLLTELEFLKRLKTELENGVSARAVEADDDEKAILADIGLLSAKPVIYACNMSEDDFASNIENNEKMCIRDRNKSVALEIAAQTVLGSAKKILESDEHPWELIDKVCSPGGTTIEGIVSLQKDGFESAVCNAVDLSLIHIFVPEILVFLHRCHSFSRQI